MLTSEEIAEGTAPGDAGAFRRLQRSFFDTAETKRRWNIDESIPWETVKYRAVATDLVEVLEAFYATEMYLPDYTAKLLELNRNNQGVAWFLANWGYEESKHSLGIEQWMLRSGRRTEQDMERLNAALLAGEWQLPFETSRQMMVYSCLQELATQRNYLNLAKLTAPAGDGALQRLLLLIASDEGVHHKIMAEFVKTYMQADRAGTIADLRHVLQNFAMPAHEVIPDWERRGELIERLRIYGGRQFVLEVLNPTLKRLGISRSELRARCADSPATAPAARTTATPVESSAPG
jgi:acyl-[acyl-carrier-protein] desaturase